MNVHVPLSPAGHVNIQLVDENLMDRAVFAVYKHKTQENDKLYVNLSESDLTLTPGQIVALTLISFGPFFIFNKVLFCVIALSIKCSEDN